jgi:outer membrane protein OmpA-like peptidoglycan-associated protein
MMRRINLTVIVMMFSAVAAVAQNGSVAPAASSANYDVAFGYSFLRANAPPSSCGCFSMNGGFVSADLHLNEWLGLTGRFTMGHANHISALGQDLTLQTFTVGPRFTYRMSRVSLFGDVLVGGARGSGSYFPTSTGSTTSASSFAYSTGGGIDLPLTSRWGLRLVDAEFLHTGLPNGVNGSQHQLEISTGLIFRFGRRAPRVVYVAPPSPKPLPPQVEFSCSQSAEQIPVGEPLEIIGNTLTEPGRQAVNYNWTASGGSIEGSGSMISVETAGLTPGTYHVYGHAMLQAHPDATNACDVSFAVVPAQPREKIITRTVVQKESPAFMRELAAFRQNMQDAFFDLNQYNLRPDAKAAVDHDAQYLLAHPDMNITIAGFADERGTAEYNIMLGLQRALAVRKALAAEGVDIGRMNVLSYGKEKQFCTTTTPACYQENRRAHFELTPPMNP